MTRRPALQAMPARDPGVKDHHDERASGCSLRNTVAVSESVDETVAISLRPTVEILLPRSREPDFPNQQLAELHAAVQPHKCRCVSSSATRAWKNPPGRGSDRPS